MAATMQHDDLLKLKSFIDFVNTNPTVLNMPSLQFLKDFIKQFGGKVPAGDFKMPETGSKCPFGGDVSAKGKPAKSAAGGEGSDKSDEESSASEPESDVDLVMEGVIKTDNDPTQPMGDSEKKPTEEEIDQAGDLRSKAAAAFSEQKFDEAITFYTMAIELNPGNALFHAKRGQVFLKLRKPNACIRDCDKALELNCDSASAYKFRGRAHRLLGQFEEAAMDLRQACKLDFDEEADEWLREVTPNAKKIEQHRIKQDRKQAEHMVKERQRAQRRARKEQEKQSTAGRFPAPGAADFPGTAGFPGACGLSGAGSFPGAGGMPAGFDMGELMSKMKDPEVATAMHDMLANPANISKYVSNPKILNLIKNFFPGGFPGCDQTADGDDAGDFTDAKGDTPAVTSKLKVKKESADYVDDGLD